MLEGENYSAIEKLVRDETLAVGRKESEVRLIAVSKTVDSDAVARAMALGARDFGENRHDVLMGKVAVHPDVNWHFIGNIQSRRIPDIVAHATLIHSLFQMRHAEKISACALSLGKVQDVLIEVNVSGEDSKSGASPDEAPELVRAVAALPGVCVRGLMTMAPQGDLDVARQTFNGLRELRDAIAATLDADARERFTELSMGMSEDWRVAIQEGATMVRIGRAIFSSSFVG